MTLYVVLLGAAGAIGLFITTFALLHKPEEQTEAHPVLARYQEYLNQAQAGPAPVKPKRSLREQIAAALDRHTAKAADESMWGNVAKKRRGLAEELERADVALRAEEWVGILIGAGVVVFLILLLRFGILPAIIGSPITAYGGGELTLSMLRKRRTNKFANQLGDVILKMSNALKAGYSFGQALQATAAAARAPAGPEFGRAVKEIQLGVPVEEALRRLVERTGSEDLDLVVSAININRIVGGNLAETLDKISETIRERVRIKGEIRTLTAQARASGWIITLLPIGLGGVLSMVAPDYFTPMFHQGLGLLMLGIGAVSMFIGSMIIRKIVDVDV